ncbi:MAG: PQQ-dependent sugar dehydrogenase [Balneolaceae bacterium]
MRSFIKQISFGAVILIIGVGCAPQNDTENNQRSEAPVFETKEVDTEYERISVSAVAGPFEFPWAIAFLPDNRYLVTERPGRLNIVENDEIIPVNGLPEVRAVGQGGLMDVVLHPDYENNGWIYLTYSKPQGDETATTLIRSRLDGTDLVDVEEIFIQDRYSSPGRHYGSKLAWSNDGKLFMSIGDRGANPPRAQDLGDHAGTLLRLNDDGTPAEGNPFTGRNDALDEIYSYGHRNIQGLVIDPESGKIWGTEHGPRGGDELNHIEAGKNYGWPTITFGLDYRTEEQFPHAEARRMEGMEEPFYEFLPTHSPSGLALVTSDKFPRWKGNLLAGGLRGERIRRVVFDEREVLHEEEILLGSPGRIRDVREAPNGDIYILHDSPQGYIYRIGKPEEPRSD